MSYQISWLYKDRVLLVDYRGIVTFDDLQQVYTDLYNHLNTSSQTLHVVVDLTNVNKTTFQVRDLSKLSEIQRLVMTHPQNGWQVYCNFTSKAFFDFVGSVLVNVSSLGKLKFVAGPNDATTFLVALDPSLAQSVNFDL